MASADRPKEKKRKPPSFPHHHPSQARKLKAQWIEREKVRSKWRAEKRRDPTLRPNHTSTEGEMRTDAGEDKIEYEEWSGIQQPPQNPKPKAPVDPAAAAAQREEQRALARAAYSPAFLHHHKSRFDHKRPRMQTDKRTSGGQPDMRLRMNALLDRIKQTTSPA